jgi:hypothetical protein
MPNPPNKIQRFMHCRHCVQQKRRGQIEVGLTADGLQVWCKYHNMQVASFTPDDLRTLVAAPPACDCCPGGRHLS